MDIRIKADGFEMTEAMSAYLDERLKHIEKLLANDAELTRCEVELGRDAGRPRHGANILYVEMQLFRPGEPSLRATNHSESVNGAIDDAKAELERQLGNEKRVNTRELRKGGEEAKRLLREEE
jgi:ribosomal subunit interface protein